LKGVVDNQKERKKCLYQIFEDEKINDLIKSRKMDDAKDYIDKLIRGLE
jgi:precorrin-2 dehydrogenase/sirohydrochlorin ferrochelatase